jgi:GNAT superfamily N-acetyltransferase
MAVGMPDGVEVVTAAERPDLWVAAESDGRFAAVWPDYNHHGNDAGRYFGALFPEYADLQVLIVDRSVGEVIARGRTIPFRWDHTLEDLPRGIDAVGLRAVEENASPSALSALAAEVLPDFRGRGIAGLVIESMAAVARVRGFDALVAPVRPSWKHRYPITPIEQYSRWRRDDGLPFDPWLRVHARLGGSILRAEPESMRIVHPVADWERWVQMRFPAEGDFVFPAGLAPLSVRADTGTYWEPNVWVYHELSRG